MKKLLDGRFAPLTYRWGFLRAPLDDLVQCCSRWWDSFNYYGPKPGWVCERFQSDLADALPKMEPLNLKRSLLMQTDSAWTAVFGGGISGPQSEVYYLSTTLPCKGLLIRCVEDTYDPKTRRGKPGGVQFAIYGNPNPRSLGLERSISATNQCDRWEFRIYGDPYPFEHTERYKARKIRDRFTPEMLEEYCLAMGVRLFDPGFYGPNCAWFRITLAPGKDFVPDTFEAAQIRLELRPPTP